MATSIAWIEKADRILKPDGNRPWRPFVASMIAEAVRDIDNPVIVDVGCGPSSWMLANANVQKGMKIGLDLDPEAGSNKDMDLVLLSPAERLPLADNSADLIIASYVLEHLENPRRAFKEFARVLKPGGKLIAWASNKWNYAIMLSGLTPTSVHNWVRRAAISDLSKDNCPTYYRANTAGAVRKFARAAGLEHVELLFGSCAYRYFGFFKPLLVVAALASRAISATPLQCLKSILILRAEKPTR